MRGGSRSSIRAPIRLEADRAEIAARATAAIIKGTCDESMCPYHKEWAPSRKIDLATWPGPDEFRAKVAGYLSGKEIDVSIGYPAVVLGLVELVPDDRPRSRASARRCARHHPLLGLDGLDEIEAVGKRYGMTEGERDWVDWYEGGKQGERPNVPQTIPDPLVGRSGLRPQPRRVLARVDDDQWRLERTDGIRTLAVAVSTGFVIAIIAIALSPMPF